MSERKAKMSERVRELMLDDDVTDTEKVVYTWDHGYETLEHWVDGGGSSHYGGVFHPGGGTCDTETEDGSGVCRWCGKVWHP